ncbi:calmodulin-regulated spectrin-associated protein 3-like, partial [Passer montanus]|uniref:calmodulin-regulated spectrin-associated protein 3-like n=1 Tax=Passer montanus TaxID=9160 RepID=UPI001960E06A
MAPALKLNVGAFLAELFLCFEVLRPPFVTPRQLEGGSESPAAGEAPNPKSSSPGFNFRHPLLAGGGQPPGLLPHSPSLPHGDAFGKGWSKRPLSHPLSQAVSFSIPFGLDSDVDRGLLRFTDGQEDEQDEQEIQTRSSLRFADGQEDEQDEQEIQTRSSLRFADGQEDEQDEEE